MLPVANALEVGKCPRCGSVRVFELQLLPCLLTFMLESLGSEQNCNMELIKAVEQAEW